LNAVLSQPVVIRSARALIAGPCSQMSRSSRIFPAGSNGLGRE
jgi:hypothetical protein